MQGSKDNRRKELARSLKFTLFSISAGAIQLLSFTLMQLLTPLPYWPTYLISLVLSVVYNFTINRAFTFRSQANVPVAMLKVFGYYCVFTPFSTIVGNYLVEMLGWNEFLVELLSMLVNFVTEFLFTRFIVYGKAVDNSKSYLEKHSEEAVAESAGPVISRKAIVICAASIVLCVAITVSVLLLGYRPDDTIKGRWKTYIDGEEMTYVCDGSRAVLSDSDGHESALDYTVSADQFTFTDDEHTQVYIWSREASTFVADHEYGESQKIIADKSQEIENFRGYITVEGDFLYLGTMCMCRESALDGYNDSSPVGEWIGAAGDKLTMTADGGYHYIDWGLTYDGAYTVDDNGSINLVLGDETITLSSDNWGVNGRVLRLSNQYYFRAN